MEGGGHQPVKAVLVLLHLEAGVLPAHCCNLLDHLGATELLLGDPLLHHVLDKVGGIGLMRHPENFVLLLLGGVLVGLTDGKRHLG